jgi:hypothetical protein
MLPRITARPSLGTWKMGA